MLPMAVSFDELARRRIVRWRTNSQMTQAKLAALIGRNPIWVSRYENGRFNADFDTLARIAKVFGQTLHAALDIHPDDDEQEIIECYRAIRAEKRALVRALLQEWAGQTRGRKGQSSRG